MTTVNICTIDDCDRKSFGRGWCQRHYTNWHTRGNPESEGLFVRGDLRGNYLRKVTKLSPNECWPWSGATASSGYGSMRAQGRPMSALQIGWFIRHGEWPNGLSVCHTCDVGWCHNPAHWWLGTQAENWADMAAKGRRAGPAKITSPEQDREILKRSAQGMSNRAISRQLGVGRWTVDQTILGHR